MEIYKNKLIMIKEDSFEYNKQICDSGTCVDFIKNILKIQNEPEEVLCFIAFDTKNNVTGFSEIARGTLTHVETSGREIFKRVLAMNCSKIILTHNHPTGDPTPSKYDLDFTQKMEVIAKLLDIQILDHIIIGDKKSFSIIYNKFI